MKKLLSLPLLLIFFSAANLRAMELESPAPGSTVLVFGLDDVINDKKIVENPQDVLKLLNVAAIILKHPTLAWNIKEIIAKGKEIFNGSEAMQPTNGTANIVYKLMKWLEDEKQYDNMTQYARTLTESFVNPAPKPDMLALLQELRNHGYTLIYATNQDSIQHTVYRRKMREKGCDLGSLFAGGVSHYAYDAQLGQESFALCDHDDFGKDTWFITRAIKPQKEFFDVVQKLVEFKSFARKIDRMLFIDRERDHAQGPMEAHSRQINFESAAQLRAELQKLGILKSLQNLC